MGNEMLTIRQVLQILRKRLVLIVVIVLISTCVAAGISKYALKPEYLTSTQLFIGKEIKEGNQDYQASEISMYQKLMTTYARIIQSEDLIERAIKDKSVGMSARQILSLLQVKAGDDDLILTMSITTSDRSKGKEILELLITEFMNTSEELIPNGNVQILATPRVPSGPIGPNTKMNTLIGFALGVMIALTLALFLEYLDNSIKSTEEIEKLIDVPVIGVIEEFKEKKQKGEKKKAMQKVVNENEDYTVSAE